ncbi:hypothetical protein BD769DRAFT_1778038 [Suillus cothurnatus]|nr:hypothetical protein BD769DRAFT_1778038 [Suillus cothurnatus]
MSISPLLAHNDEVELTDEEDDSGRDSIKSASDPNDEDEEMAVDHMLMNSFFKVILTRIGRLSIHTSSVFPQASQTRSPDCVSVPPFPKGITKAGYRSSNASTGVPKQGVEHLSIGHALAAAFAQNVQPPSPSLSLKGKERERERPPPVLHFGDDASTVPTQIMDAQYPALELDIRELPIHQDTILQSSLPEMIAGIKGLAVPDDEKDEKEDEPVFPRVLASLFQERPDIEAALTPYFGRVPAKGSSRKGKIKSKLEPQIDPSLTKPKSGLAGTVPQTQDPSSSNVPDGISHYTTLEEDQILDFNSEMDQYLNDLGDSPAKTYPPDIKHTQSAPNSFLSSLHSATRLPHDTASVTREDAEDSFFGVPPSPRLLSESPSLQLTDMYATNSSHSLDGSFDFVLPEDGQWSLSPDSFSPPDSVGTIDPSLLGGSEPPLPSTGARSSKPPPAGPIIYVRRPPRVSASQEAPALSDKKPGKSRRNVQIKYRTSKSTSITDEGGATSSARKLDDGEGKDDRGWTADAVSAPPAQLGARPSLKIRIRRTNTRASSDGSFAPSKASSSTSSPVFTTPFPEAKPSKLHTPPPPAQTTPRNDDEPEVVKIFCHHCRSTQTRPKMQCSKRHPDRTICGKRFCNRCILNRYPDIVFAPGNKKLICPVCLNTCNCSICSRRRGEEYISMRGGGFAGSRTKSGILLVPDDSRVPDGSITPEPPESTPKPQFWAHVYGLEGERVGRAFIDGDSASAPVRPTQPVKQRAQTERSKQKVKAKLKKKPRVFIGTPLREWKIRTIKDLEPSVVIPPLVSEKHVGKGKGKAVDRPRVYIGDARWLYVPYTRMPLSASSSRASSPDSDLELDSDGTLTPLEDLEEGMGWPQPEERSASSSLSPDDLVKAIGVALAATRKGTGER